MKTVLLIDAYNMIHRARYGFGEGEHATTFNFFRLLKSEIERHNPSIVYLVDEGRPLQSLAIDPNYKGNRTSILDASFHRQKAEIFEIAKTMLGVVYAKNPNCECDDVIAYLAEKHCEKDNVTIVSTDTDFIQLLGVRKIALWNPIKKMFIDPWPCEYTWYKSLVGDSTDNVPGVPGIGHKTALRLASDSQLLDEFFQKKPETKEIYDRALKMIGFKSMNDDDVQYVSSVFDAQKLHHEFSNREFKSIIGKAWPKWVETFGGLCSIETQDT